MEASRGDFERRIRELCERGHRGSATDEERWAAEYLVNEFGKMDVPAKTESFMGSQSLGMRILLHVGVAMAGFLFLWSAPLITLILAVGSLVSLIAEQATRGVWLSRCCVQSPSQNVVAILPAVGAAVARIILCGHYDTQRTGRIWKLSRLFAPLFWISPPLLQSPLLFVALTMAAEAALAFLVAIFGASFFVSIAAAAMILIHGAIALLLWDWYVSPSVPGAADNASGVAGVMAITEAWIKNPADGIELIVLLPGCEESGLLGSAAWLDRQLPALKDLPVLFLNLDALSFGPPRYLAQETPVCGLPLSYEKSTLAVVAEVASELGCKNARVIALPGPTDGLAFLARGLDGITLFGCRDRGEFPNYHTMEDSAGNVDCDAAWDVVAFAWRVLHRFCARLKEDAVQVRSHTPLVSK